MNYKNRFKKAVAFIRLKKERELEIKSIKQANSNCESWEDSWKEPFRNLNR